MSEIFHASSGLRRLTRMAPPVKLRFAAFAVAVLAGAILFTWLESTRWEQIRDLEQEFATVQFERYYLAIKLRLEAQHLSDTLLAFYHGKASNPEAFRQEADALKKWVETHKSDPPTPAERAQFDLAETELNTYLDGITPLLKERREPPNYELFNSSPEDIRQWAEPLFKQCDRFVEAQHRAFRAFVSESKHTLTTHRLLLKVSLLILLALAAALVVLVYRGMIAPLRHQLTQSRAIIERQEKLASLGVLAAGVAHEIRNPLTAIKFRLFSLKKSLAILENNEDAAVIGSEINRLERIVRDFLQFARPSEPELVEASAPRILQEVHTLLKSQLEKVAIRLKLEPSDTAWVRADVQQIKQVLINLIQNSADSIGRNGAIALRVSRPTAPFNGQPTPVVALEVSDNGKGIPPDVQKRLFDPFFTTKEGGTGLGLPIAARIVEKHGGELRYETELNRGTTFRIVLPLLPEEKNAGLQP